MLTYLFYAVIIFVISLLGGYVRLCLFGSFSFTEATVLIIAMDIGFLISFLVCKVTNLDSEYEELIMLVSALLFSLIGELVYKRKIRVNN